MLGAYWLSKPTGVSSLPRDERVLRMVHADAYPGSQRSLISIHAAGVRGVQFLDCRLARDYAAGHIPSARHVDVRGLRQGSLSELPPWRELANHFAALGIDGEQTIVPYADRHTFSLAGYVWWLLRYVGYGDVRVLHGGFETWESAGFPVEPGAANGSASRQESGARPLPSLARRRWPWPFAPLRSLGPLRPPKPTWATEASQEVRRALVDARWIQEHQDDDRIRLVDARTLDEFVAGHIPHSSDTRNISHDTVFDTSEGALVHPDQLMEYLASIERGKRVVAYCRSGVRSGTLLWALAAAGYDSLRNYDGSILDWEHRRLPLEKGRSEGDTR